MENKEFKKEVLENLYQQLQLLAENINKEENISRIRTMMVDFRLISKTILFNNPTTEQRQWIFETANKQIKMLSEKKSVYLSDTFNDLANFVFYFF